MYTLNSPWKIQKITYIHFRKYFEGLKEKIWKTYSSKFFHEIFEKIVNSGNKSFKLIPSQRGII